MSLNRLLCNCGMLFCKDNDSVGVGVGTSALSNVASMFFRSLLNYSNSNNSSSTNSKAINEEKIDHPTITTNTDSIDDDGILYCMPIVTTDKVKKKRKGTTKAIKAQRKDMKMKK